MKGNVTCPCESAMGFLTYDGKSVSFYQNYGYVRIKQTIGTIYKYSWLTS
jgi:hypothetical protein